MRDEVELHAIFKGRVQGVGFRWTVLNHAKKLAVHGTVKNLEDGSVEVYASGEKKMLEHFVDQISKNPGMAELTAISAEYQKSNTAYPDFQIIV